MSECSSEYAKLQLKERVNGMQITHIGWRDIQQMARRCSGTHAEKRLLDELRIYLERIVKVQDQQSNLVYVVSLGMDTPKWSTLSWKKIVEEGRYFHPVGTKGWPKEPPNYIGFRYDGRLQSIHHVDEAKITTDVHAEMPELTPGPWPSHFIYTLGPPIRPDKVVKSGKVYRSARVWAMLDLLLTCDSISEAAEQTKQRRAGTD